MIASLRRPPRACQGAGGRTTLTLLGADLFASGRAELNPGYVDTLQRIAAALGRRAA